MFKLGYIGTFESVPKLAAAICNHDMDALKELLTDGDCVNRAIEISEYSRLYPLEIAVLRSDVDMTHYLLEHGANPDLYAEQALLLLAIRSGSDELIELFVPHAAKLSCEQKERAFQEVRWSKNYHVIEILEKASISVAKFAGQTLRAAASDGDMQLVQLLCEKGVDVNYHKSDMVFPYASTAVTEAARANHFDLVRYLVERGADIKISDKYGDRPYSLAQLNGNDEMAAFLKSLEPEDWHNEQQKLLSLRPFKLPVKMLNYLKNGPHRLEFPEGQYVRWVQLYTLMDVQVITYKRKKLLSLLQSMDNYSDCLLLWSAKDKKLWYLDYEHDEFHPLCKWDEFIADPAFYINGMISGEFDK